LTNEQQTENNKLKTVNFLIVGQGLAGSLLAWELHLRGLTFAIVDEGLDITSSRIAAGMFNPINTKRFTVAYDAERAIGEALELYRSIERELGISLVEMRNIYNVFGNVKEGNDYTLKADDPFFKQYTNAHPADEDHVIQPYGAFEVGLSGRVDVRKMLDALKTFIADKYTYLEETFEYSQLQQNNSNNWSYKHIAAPQVVFCEGYKANLNPFFPDINIVPCKGDVLEITAPGFTPSRVVKKGIYLVPLGDGKFKAGSTYKWHNADEQAHEADKIELEQKISELIDVPFTVTSHQTAIRPTTRTRETFIKTHPEHSTLHAINGLGTKGVINGVRFVKEFLTLI
jgi:glycine oxidase